MQIPRDLRLRLDAVDGPLADPGPLRFAAVLAPLLPADLDLGTRLLL
ncbi:MAG: hypothetical protein H0T76_22145, partial [Nannocystis sp.]|nr:hypothetical protein [Nannocystis sp.]